MQIDERLRAGADAIRRHPLSADDRSSARTSVTRRQASRRRRRLTAASAAAVAVVLGGVAAVAGSDHDPRVVETRGREQVSEPAPTTTRPTPDSTAPTPSVPGEPEGLPETTTSMAPTPTTTRRPATDAGPPATTSPAPPSTDPEPIAPESTTTTAAPPTTTDPAPPFPLLAPGELPPPLPGVLDTRWSTRASQWAWTRPEAYAVRVHVVWMGTASGPYDVVVRGRGAGEVVTVTDPYTGAAVEPTTPFLTIDAIYGYIVAEFATPVTIATDVGAEAVPAEVVATYPNGDPLAHVTISAFRVLP